MSDEEAKQHKEEYELLLAAFMEFLKNMSTDDEEEKEYALMELRATLLINHAYDGFQIDEEDALELLRNTDERLLSQQEKNKKDRLVAAIENLIPFAVCEEYQLTKQTKKVYKAHQMADEDYDIDWDNPDEVAEYTDVNELYNDQYAAVENADVAYAMGIALWWIGMGSNDLITYWTMNDAKVRPWHMALQGYTASRDEFPAWMIPPIEWNCRCFLLEAWRADEVWNKGNLHKVMNKMPSKPEQIKDNTFSDSVAKCGPIFGSDHNYFKVDKADKTFLDQCVKRIKDKYYGKAD